jgi:hypothetical protein
MIENVLIRTDQRKIKRSLTSKCNVNNESNSKNITTNRSFSFIEEKSIFLIFKN